VGSFYKRGITSSKSYTYLAAFNGFWSEPIMSARSFRRHRRERPKEST